MKQRKLKEDKKGRDGREGGSSQRAAVGLPKSGGSGA